MALYNEANFFQPYIELINGMGFGFGGIFVGIVLTLLITIAITRDTQEMKTVQFIIMLCLFQLGLNIHIVIIFLSMLLYATTLFSENKLYTSFLVPIGKLMEKRPNWKKTQNQQRINKLQTGKKGKIISIFQVPENERAWTYNKGNRTQTSIHRIKRR